MDDLGGAFELRAPGKAHLDPGDDHPRHQQSLVAAFVNREPGRGDVVHVHLDDSLQKRVVEADRGRGRQLQADVPHPPLFETANPAREGRRHDLPLPAVPPGANVLAGAREDHPALAAEVNVEGLRRVEPPERAGGPGAQPQAEPGGTEILQRPPGREAVLDELCVHLLTSVPPGPAHSHRKARIREQDPDPVTGQLLHRAGGEEHGKAVVDHQMKGKVVPDEEGPLGPVLPDAVERLSQARLGLGPQEDPLLVAGMLQEDLYAAVREMDVIQRIGQ